MSIEYRYTIINVDKAARCMEVVYEAEGHQTMHIGARLPYEGEALENVIRAFAPVQLWMELSADVVSPTVGATGIIPIAPVTTAQLTHEQLSSPNAQMWQQVTFDQQVAGALVRLGVLDSDPTTIEVSKL
jgi:hypothetical protein